MQKARETLQESIAQQRRELLEVMQVPLQHLATRCNKVWADRAKLDLVLSEGLKTLPYGRALYALDTGGIQISSNVSVEGLMPASV